jgi:hypothetical protein
MMRDFTRCLQSLETWKAFSRAEGGCVFTFVNGEFFEVSARDLEYPSTLLLELVYAVYDDYEASQESYTFDEAASPLFDFSRVVTV